MSQTGSQSFRVGFLRGSRYFPFSVGLSKFQVLPNETQRKREKERRTLRSPLTIWALQVLCVDDTGARILTGLQLHCGDEPAARACGAVVECGAISVLGVLWVDDGGALVADRPLPRLQVHLGLVAPPCAVPHCHHCLAEGGGRGNWGAQHPVSVMLVGVVLDL